MRTHYSDRRKALGLILFLTSIFSGCGPEAYRDPIAKFQDASSVVIASTRIYVTELNKVERDKYLLGQAGDKAQIKIIEMEEAQAFSQDGLKARLDTLDQLAGYGDLLSKLANSDAPERIRAESANLGEALRNLTATVGGLTGADDQRFKAAVGPVASLIGEVLDLVAQKKINDALEKAVRGGDVPVNNLITAIRGDIEIAYQRRRNSLSEIRVRLVDDYNREFAKGDTADREKLRTLAERIRAHEDRWEVFAGAHPGESLDAMKDAHSALVDFAKSGSKKVSLATLADAMETFAARAKRIGQAVQALREI